MLDSAPNGLGSGVKSGVKSRVKAVWRTLRKLTRPRSNVRSVSVYYVSRAYYVATLYGSEGGDPCVGVGPVAKVERHDQTASLGEAIRTGLAQCRYDFPFPSSPEAWKNVPSPILGATGFKTWVALAKRANTLRIDQEGPTIKISPAARGPKQAFYPVAERNLSLESPSDAELGRAVMAELDFARAAEGPA